MLAYLDAGTGSMVIGAVAAGVAGAGVAVRTTLGRFRRKKAAVGDETSDLGSRGDGPGAPTPPASND